MVVVGVTFGIVALAELADTSGLVTLVLASRFSASLVLLGVCAAFVVQVGVAVAAGSVVALLPEQPLEAVLAVVFLVGAVLLLREDDDDDDVAADDRRKTEAALGRPEGEQAPLEGEVVSERRS